MTRGSCGHDTTQDGAWPLSDGSDGCYDCFSAEADRGWWAELAALDAAGLL